MRYKIMFVGGEDINIPILVPSHNIAKQFDIEVWLDSESLLETFGLKQVKPKRLEYVV